MTHDPTTCPCRLLLDSPAARRGRAEALERISKELPASGSPPLIEAPETGSPDPQEGQP